MQLYWFDGENIPEGAELYDPRKMLRFDAHRGTQGPIVLGNPIGEYGLRPFAPTKKWVELYSDHHFNNFETKTWATSSILKSVGIISGFGTEIGLQIALAGAVKEKDLPKGAKNASILFVNGPNLNLLGTREPEIYGDVTLAQIFEGMRARHPELAIRAMQSNNEGDLVSEIQQASEHVDAIIINAGAYTHTSIAIYDALKTFPDIVIELHVSNPHQREEFRHKSYIAPVSHGLIAGFGPRGYELALMGAMSKL